MNYNYNLSYESAFYAHYFSFSGAKDEHKQAAIVENYQPNITVARTDNVEQKTEETWFAWHSGTKYDGVKGIATHKRPSVQFVFVLDISGSMSFGFEDSEHRDSRITVAKKVLISFLDQIDDDDHFGLIVFNQNPTVLHAIEQWKHAKQHKQALIQKIDKLRGNGGTEITLAYNAAFEMLSSLSEQHQSNKRIFFLTDMEVGGSDGDNFSELVATHCKAENVFASIGGIGCDLHGQVIESVSACSGCNYFNIMDAADFVQIIQNEFDYMVTAVAFNCTLTILSEHCIEKGFGSPEVRHLGQGQGQDAAGNAQLQNDDNSMVKSAKQITCFPSYCDDKDDIRSGLVLFKLRSGFKDKMLRLKVEWDDMNGITHNAQFEKDLSVRGDERCYFENTGIRKAILLTKYVDFVQEYDALRKTVDPTKEQMTLFESYGSYRYEAFVDGFVLEMTNCKDPSLLNELKQLKFMAENDGLSFDIALDEADCKRDESSSETKNNNKNRKRKLNEIDDDGDESANEPALKKQKLNAEFYCPITLEIMHDPVITADGATYERSAIQEWLQQNDLSPNTGMQLPHKNLVTNYALKSLIQKAFSKK